MADYARQPKAPMALCRCLTSISLTCSVLESSTPALAAAKRRRSGGSRTPTMRLAPENGILLDAYRFDTLDAFVELTKRVPLRVAA